MAARKHTHRLLAGIAVAVGLSLPACSSDDLSAEQWRATTNASGYAEQVDEIASAADALVNAGVPGVVVRVVGPDRDETVVRGVANVDTGQPMTADELFDLAGASNPYLAAVMLEYFDEGRIDLGDSIEDHLPDHFDYAWDMAIWDVLQHASGLPDYLSVGDGRGVVVDRCVNEGYCRWEPEDAMELVEDQEWQFQPGEGWGYSNTNYVVVGDLIEEIDQKPWPDAVNERILAPLGLTDTVVPQSYDELGDRLSRGYTDLDADGTLDDVTEFLPGGQNADGAMAASPDDVVTFFHALFTGEVLSSDGQRAMFATAPTGNGVEEYGLGVSFIAGYEAGQVQVTGASLGHSVFVEHDLNDSTTTVIMVNEAGDIPVAEWSRLIGVVTGHPNRQIVQSDANDDGQTRFYCTLY